MIERMKLDPCARWLSLLGLVLGLLAAQETSAQAAKEDGPGERKLLAAFEKGFAASNAEKRSAALNALGNDSRELPDRGASKAVAKALCKGLADPELEIQNQTLMQIGFGREPETVVPSLAEYAEALGAELAKQSERASQADFVARGKVLLHNACTVLLGHPDDRSVTALVRLVAGLRPGEFGDALAGPLARACLTFGTLEAVTAVVKQTKSFRRPRDNGSAHPLLAPLNEFAAKLELPAPQDQMDPFTAWSAWLEVNAEKLNKKPGRLKAPTTGEGQVGLTGLPAKNG
jgi:hypothetical protein